MGRRVIRNRKHPNLRLYEEDFDQVALRFRDIMADGQWIALPGAVVETVVPSENDYPSLSLPASAMTGYKMDTGAVLATEKRKILPLLAKFEARDFGIDDYTLAPGVSSALLFVNAALKRLDVNEVIFELPSYFAAIEQAEMIGMNVGLFLTSPETGFRVTQEDLAGFDRISDKPVALVITQPRYGLGYNREPRELTALRKSLKKGDVLVIDEAADQSVPSPFGLTDLEGDVAIIRIRGLTKGLGLNSIKIAAIFHPSWMRSMFGELVDFAGGALDAAAMKLILEFAENPDRYIELLSSARSYVMQQYATLKRATTGLPVSIAPIQSSYLATAHFPAISGMDFDEFRARFLDATVQIRLPVVRGSSLYFPYDESGEIIRINYFTTPENMHQSAIAFQKLVTSLYGHP